MCSIYHIYCHHDHTIPTTIIIVPLLLSSRVITNPKKHFMRETYKLKNDCSKSYKLFFFFSLLNKVKMKKVVVAIERRVEKRKKGKEKGEE